MKKIKLECLPLFAWTALFTISPLIILSLFAITDKQNCFTLNNLLKIGFYGNIILRSLIFAIITTTICLMVAYPFAYFIFKIHRKTTQKLIIALITLPMWTNLLLRTFAWMTLIEKNGLINKMLRFLNLPQLKLINTPAAVILVMVYDFLPFIIMPIYSSLSKIDHNIIEASHDLGASEFQTFKRIILPLSLKGVFHGIGMIFVLSCSTFIIPRMMSGSTIVLVGDLIESQFMGPIYNPWLGSALALGLNVTIILIMIIASKLKNTKKEVLQNEAEFFL